MRILALGAHPDDIEIYAYGALAAWKAMGAELVLAIATDGSKGGKVDPAGLRLTRQAEARAATRSLSVEPIFLDFVDGELVPDGAVITRLKQLITETSPTLIVTHAPNDYHGDHRALSEAVRLAASFSSPVVWVDNMQGVGFMPTHYVDITAHFAAKAAAIRHHVSQGPERFVSLAEQLNSFRAAQSNQPAGSYAEAYRFEPHFPFVDIRELFPPAPPVGPVRDRRSADD